MSALPSVLAASAEYGPTTFGASTHSEKTISSPHSDNMYVDAAYCCRPISVICLSVRLSVCHDREPCRNRSTDRDAVWVVDSGKEPYFRRSQDLVTLNDLQSALCN